ncbi:MAG: heparinase II/III family protein [Candidatus Hydrogenedentes bacterium]|nr:heparinase II/III family protein [Candidatus Hydrogenedentota bacterium]
MRTAMALTVVVTCSFMLHAQDLNKTGSVLYPQPVVDQVRTNVANDPWAAGVRDRVVEAAAFWREMSDEDLWALMFSPNLERSWMVWSNGYSPVTGEPVPMYNWKADAKTHPWKLQDPTSGEWFPKNDFGAFYKSGLDERGWFDPARADRALLFNTEHPDPNDPKHLFGVDDGTGYVNGKGEKWRFIAAYLIYGHWKQLIVGGVRVLSAAYMLTGEPVYAHKTGILLDRVADFYPEFDFGKQGVMYEGPPSAGYVSTWHDACEETRELVMAYDMVFDGLRGDQDLVAFLSQKAGAHGLENPKASWTDLQRNIEGGILRDLLVHQDRIHSNYPRDEILKAVTVAVLQEPEEAFWGIVDPMMERATAVDGVTGEKGLAGYASFTIAALASFLSEFSKADPAFLTNMLDRYPQLHDTYRFFIDTHCLNRYYPFIGDTGHYAAPAADYVGVDFLKPGENLTGWGNWTLLAPSNFQFMWRLYEATGDTAFAQLAYRENGGTAEGLPFDLYGQNSESFRDALTKVIKREGTLIPQQSVNKSEWHLGILRSGWGGDARALWIDYDAGGPHGHKDGLNLGLFAHGLDVLPELGYPPVQYGGWGSPRALWYTRTAAHNTVVVDRKDQVNGAGESTLWFDGSIVRGIRVSAPVLAGVERYERTVLLVDIDDENFYVVDVFQVRGGGEHTKFVQSHYGDLSMSNLALAPAEDFGANTETRNFQMDPRAPGAWRADWTFEDKYQLLSDTAPRGMRYHDFTTGASAGTCEMWLVANSYNGGEEVWVPRVVVQRKQEGETPLVSTFVSVLEPWKNAPVVQSVQRIEMPGGDTEVALEITLPDGAHDLVIVRDLERMAAEPAVAVAATELDGEVALVRVGADGQVRNIALANGSRCTAAGAQIQTPQAQACTEYNGL